MDIIKYCCYYIIFLKRISIFVIGDFEYEIQSSIQNHKFWLTFVLWILATLSKVMEETTFFNSHQGWGSGWNVSQSYSVWCLSLPPKWFSSSFTYEWMYVCDLYCFTTLLRTKSSRCSTTTIITSQLIPNPHGSCCFNHSSLSHTQRACPDSHWISNAY